MSKEKPVKHEEPLMQDHPPIIGRRPIKYEKPEPVVPKRRCKQCGKLMKDFLKVDKTDYMFCSLECKNGWDHQRAYKPIEPLE
jgi:hypothetical protein